MNFNLKTLVFRYLILLLIAIPNLFLLYFIFTPLTVYPVFWLLKFFYNADLVAPTVISFNQILIHLIPACIAGAAYYLLLILNLTTPMPLKTRINSLIFLLLSFLILNILRIFFFAILALSGFQYFDLAHEFVWYIGSTVLVVILWFINIHIFKIKAIPIYSDFKELYKKSK
tara:strand:+ start:25461 stop:25976 length:516 start_codon:yes stop_codon:yes gene_type:complete